MLTDRELRSEFVMALEAVTPPAPWLLETIERAATQQVRRRRRITFGFRVSLRLIAAVVLIALFLSGTAVFLAIHHAATNMVPAGHGYSRATSRADWGMVSATVGWEDSDSLDASTGWHHILRTTDGGSHWKDVSPPSSLTTGPWQALNPLLSAPHYILDADHLWVVLAPSGAFGRDGSFVSPALVMIRTSDGGQTWERGLPFGTGAQGDVFSFSFLDGSHGWLLLQSYGPLLGPTLFSTVDGGLNWQTVPGQPTGMPMGCSPNGIAFASHAVGWASADCSLGASIVEQLLVTRDGGSTWSDEPLPLGAGELGSAPPVVFDQEHAEYLVGSDVLMTADAGGHWSARALPGQRQLVVDFIDSQHGWTIAGQSLWFVKTSQGLPSVPNLVLPLYRTDDGGLTWSQVPTAVTLDSNQGRVSELYFVDQKNGFLERVNATAQQTFLFRTTDGGQTWALVGRMPPQ